jgi:hypothetical protein
MKLSRIAMVVVSAFFLLTGGYWLYSGRPQRAGLAAVNAIIALVVFRRLRDAPRAV